MFKTGMLSAYQVPLLLLLVLRSVLVNSVSSPPTFEHRDPTTGTRLQCDSCPPGTFMRARCSAVKGSDCAPCPDGSFTALWNYIGKCLRCGACQRNEVVKRECSANSDCECECKDGYFYREESGMCVRHSECPSGEGVMEQGTAEKDTVCHICSNGTFSDISSAQHVCKKHKSCSDAGLQTVLKGSSWHDSVCANCGELKDGAEYLGEIIPAFFIHHKVSVKRLRRIVHKLPSEDGKKQAGALESDLTGLHLRLSSWASSATAAQIRQLVDIVVKIRARRAREKLQKKLKHINTHLERCSHGSVMKVDRI